MKRISTSGGAAFDATVQTSPERTPGEQAYLDQVAADAERAVAHTEATIADLEASLEGRRAEAQQARAVADNNRIDGKEHG
jgi:hypothetical protein